MRGTKIAGYVEMPGEYYVWSVDKKPVDVYLSLGVVDRLQKLVSETFQRGLGEIHGILLGRIERRDSTRIAYIEDFELFDPAAGAPKPSHRSWLDPVGLFRSRIQNELRLDRLDAALIENFFTNPGMVYLLVRPVKDGAPVAGFFIQEDGQLQGYATYREFPFDVTALRSGGYLLATDSTPPRTGKRFMWAGVTAGLAAALIAGWWFWSRTGASPMPAQPAAQQAPAPPSTPPPAERAPEPAPPSTASSPASVNNNGEAARAKTSPVKTRSKRRHRRSAADVDEGPPPAEHSPQRSTVTVAGWLAAPTRGFKRALSRVPGLGFLGERERRPHPDRSGQ
jgi:hypothetical protein